MKKVVSAILILTAIGNITAQKIPTSKFGKGINFMAADSSMTMKMHFRMQQLFDFRYDEADKGWSSNFLVRRSRLKFSGYALSPKLKYKAELGLSNRDISTNNEDGNTKGGARLILDAVLKYQFEDHWQLWVGQTKLPGNRERVISSANLQFVDRSLLNSKFTLDRDMGIQLHGKYALSSLVVKPKFALTKGEGRDITTDNIGGFSYTSRLEILPMGEFEGKKEDYMGSDLKRQSKPKLALGATYNYNQRAPRQQGQLGSFIYDSTGNYAANTLYHMEADLMFKYKGFSVMSEYAKTTSDWNFDKLSKNYHTGTGFNVQAGYLMKNNLEVAARFTNILPDNSYSGLKELDEYTFAVSRYFAGHSLKVQSDISYTHEPADAGVIRFRAQMEMQF